MAAGLQPLVLEMKEGLALLNGTHVMAALAALLVHDTTTLVRVADVSGAMSLEALMGTHVAFDARIHALRPHPGQLDSAANLRALTEESGIIASHRDCGRVQDAYSLRCMPQVHGAAREALRLAREIVDARAGQRHGQPAGLHRRRRGPLGGELPRPAARARARRRSRSASRSSRGSRSAASTAW